MCRHRLLLLLAAFPLPTVLVGAARAQIGPTAFGVPAAGTVSATGSAAVNVQPTTMRMYMQIVGRGSTLEEAVAAMKSQQEAGRKKLQELGASESSIAFTPPSRSNAESQIREQYQQMIAMRMSKVRREMPEGLKLPATVVVSSILRADWPLEAESPEKLMVAVDQLQEKIKSADVGGREQPQNLSPEEKELAEELGGMSGDYDEDTVQPGMPSFAFAATVSDDQRDKLLAEAFAKAKAQAERLARAAGASLGPLAGLGSTGADADPYEAYRDAMMYGYGRRSGLAGMLAEAAASQDPNPNEITSQQLGPIPFRVAVRAVFKLQ